MECGKCAWLSGCFDNQIANSEHPPKRATRGEVCDVSKQVRFCVTLHPFNMFLCRSEERSGLDFSTHPVYRTLGYFSIVGQLRIQCLLGDYYLALKTLEPIDLNRKGFYTRVTACHITLYYYVGFSYLMMRRYVDAIKAFSNILLYINRTKQYHTRSYQYEQVCLHH